MPDQSPRYHGIFERLVALGITDSDARATDLYGPQFAGFYDQVVGQDLSDIAFYEQFLQQQGGMVLDLACGAGRIGIALARKGAAVDGIDLSADMLALAEVNLAKEPVDVVSRVHFYQGDMTAFAMGVHYDLIIVGATSLSLLLHPEHRRALFRSVRAHLAEGGRFVFDLLNLEQERWQALDNFTDVWSREGDDGIEFAIVGQRFYPEERHFVFNLYRELIHWDGTTERSIGTSTKAWLTVGEVSDALAGAGLQVTEIAPNKLCNFFVAKVADGQP